MTEPTLSEADAIWFDPEEADIPALRAAVLTPEAVTAPPKEALLSLLAAEDYPEKVADLARVLVDGQQPSQMRQAAAYELGRLGTPEAVAVLRDTLGTGDDPTQRAVVTALGRAGGPPDLDAIDRFLQQDGGLPPDVVRAADWARSLLAYRVDVDGFELAPPPGNPLTAEAATDEARAVASAPADPGVVAQAVHDVAAEGFHIPLDLSSGTVVRCADRDHLYLQNREFASPDSLQRLTEKKSVLGIVAVLSTGEGEAWTTKYLVLTQPAPVPDRVEIHVTTTTGSPAFTGEAELGPDQISFGLRSVDQPGAIPLQLQGSYADGRPHVEQGTYEPRRRARMAPTPVRNSE
jgi:hypothetical protein